MKALQRTTVLAVSAVTAIVIGCATAPVGPTPAETVTGAQTDLHTAIEAGDVEKIMTLTSDSYSGTQAFSKDMLRNSVEVMIAQGAFETMAITMEDCKIVVEGDSATAGPVVFTSPMAIQSFEFKWKKEADGMWRVVNHELTY